MNRSYFHNVFSLLMFLFVSYPGRVASGTTVTIPVAPPPSAENPQIKALTEHRASTNTSPVSGMKEKKSKKKKNKDREHRKEQSAIKGSPIKEKQPPQLTKQPSPIEKEIPTEQSDEATRPPSSLSVHSPLVVSTDGRKTNGEVQSPAYSDISDANDSTLVSEPEGTVKVKEEIKEAESDAKERYGHLQQQQQEIYQSYLRQLPSFNGSPKTHKVKQEQPSSDVSSQRAAEQRQNMFNQYAYLAAYRQGVDPNYHKHMLSTDPNYRQLYEKHLEERKILEEQGKLARPTDHPNFPCSSKIKPQDLSSEGRRQTASPSLVKAKELPRSSPTNGPPPLLSEKDRMKQETDKHSPRVMNSNTSHMTMSPHMFDKRNNEQLMQRYYKYPPGQHASGPHGPGQHPQLVKDMSGKEKDLKDQPLDLKERRTPDHRASPTTEQPQSSSPMGGYNYPHGFLQSQGYGRPTVDPSHPMFRQHLGLLGHPTAGFMHPSQLRYPPSSEKERHLMSPNSNGTSSNESSPLPTKALELLQQRAQLYQNNGNTPNMPHKMHELANLEKGEKQRKDMAGGPSPTPVRTSTPTGKDPEHTNRASSPPPQRHLHTHHHTHVVGTPYNLYDGYGGKNNMKTIQAEEALAPDS